MISFVITKTIELTTSRTVGRLTTSYPEIKGLNPATELYQEKHAEKIRFVTAS
jgi:hypothetical protein